MGKLKILGYEPHGKMGEVVVGGDPAEVGGLQLVGTVLVVGWHGNASRSPQHGYGLLEQPRQILVHRIVLFISTTTKLI